MMNNAMDVAKYILNRCIDIKKPCSNLRLQKILFYSQIKYYEITGDKLFHDKIELTKYGPNIPSIYYKYNIYSALEIRTKQTIEKELSSKVKEIIDPIIDSNVSILMWNLVAKSKEDFNNLDDDIKSLILGKTKYFK